MRVLSDSLRMNIIRSRARGESSTLVASKFGVKLRTVQHIWHRYSFFGETRPRARSGHRVSRVAAMEPTIRGWLQREADLTLQEMCERLKDRAIGITPSALWHQLNKWKLSLKTNPERRRARTVLHARRRFYRRNVRLPAGPVNT